MRFNRNFRGRGINAQRTTAQRAIAFLRALGTSAHVWLPGANGVSVASLPSNNYLLSDGSTGYSTVDGVDGLTLDGMWALGSELGTPFDGTYTANTGVVCSGGVLTATAAAAGFMAFRDGTAVSVGKTYLVTGSYSTSSAFMVYLGGTTGAVVQAGSGTFSQYIVAAATSRFLINANNTLTGTIGNVSIKEYTGTHLTQATTANKPLVRRGAYNYVKYSETLETTGAFWAATNMSKTGGVTDPDGGSTAFTLTATAGGAEYRQIYGSGIQGVNGAWMRRRTGTGAVRGYDGVGYVAWPGLSTTWQRLTISNSAVATQFLMFNLATSGDAIDVWHPQAEACAALGDYTPTTTTAASSPSAGKYWWSFDGSNDSLLSGNLGITNACTIVIAGRVDSLGASRMLVNEDTNGVQFVANTDGSVVFGKANIVNFVTSSAGTLVAGVPFVLTIRLSGSVADIRKNGVQVASAATGGVTFSATTGMRVGAQFPGGLFFYNGALGWVVPIAAALSDADCLTVERLVGSQFPGMATF